jgi:hypothetical protein
MTKRIIRVLVCLAISVGTLTTIAVPAQAATGGTDRPWNGSGEVTGTVILGSPVRVTAVGTVNVTHLGRSAYSNVVTCSATGCANATTAVTIVAANGDTIFGSGVVTNGATRVTITGGTGRFAGASGYYDVAGTTVFTGPLTFTLTFTQSGTVSY